MTFPAERRRMIRSAKPRERLHRKIERRTDVAIARRVGAGLAERDDEWTVSRRYMTLETVRGFRYADGYQTCPSKIAAG